MPIFNNNIINNSGRNIYWLITFLYISMLCGFNSALASQANPDSITYIAGSDTMKFKRVYTSSYPEYTPALDTTNNTVTAPLAPQAAEAGLDAIGSITRGIQVSSNSSVSLQSSMYLKIKGNLSDDYTVQGVLTDKTSPLQPIGNTRRLNDFERVMIEINGPAVSASIGDIDLRLNNGKFGKVDRTIEGISVQTKSHRGALHGALGFSYGNYHLLQIQGKNGKQGPYRLSGKDGEKFIIILAGSEKVKLNDKLLIRGENDDYIIDYNAAEIHFTQNHILSANSRISVEFEYVPDIYLASYSFGKQLISGEVTLGSRSDSPFFISAAWQDIRDDGNNPLGNIEQEQLQQIFGSLGSNTSTTELSTIVLDTLNGSYDQDSSGVLVYRGDQLGDYTVDFSFVGLERGHYRKEQNAATPYYVYDPEFGEYIPAQQYIAPQSLSVFSLSGHAQKAGLDANIDVGISQDNQNLYANVEKQSQRIAWDIDMGINRPLLELRLGDKQIETGYVSHDAIESLEYYRRWHLHARLAEAEHLRYGHLRLGQNNSHYLKTSVSQMERSGSLVGQQVQIESKSDPKAALLAEYSAVLTNLDNSLSQNHALKSRYSRGKFTSGVSLNLEDGSSSLLHASNDHLEYGINASFEYSENQDIGISYIQRMDYRFIEANTSLLNSKNIENWTDLRQDWIADYKFANILGSKGLFNMKYREHSSDSGAVKRYYLGKFQVSGNALHNRFKFQENFVLDEEHIPKYDYHYIEVDTGYGDYSFDSAIQDYIPINGGRFVRQRLYSDREEQVRKYDNKSRVEYTSQGFGKLDRVAFKSRLGYEIRLKEEVQSGTSIQSQEMLSLNVDLQTGRSTQFTSLGYSGKSNQNKSTLYNYGAEENEFVSHGLDGDFIWNTKHHSKLGVMLESRERALEYNPLAQEQWISTRPFFKHLIKFSTQQKLAIDVKYSMVTDKYLDKAYSEALFHLNHGLRIKRRGRVDQQLSLSNIQADVNAIPYSVFSGRQPGDNWKYSVNGRYTFSSMFQVSMNYSIQKRGDSRNEQYLRLEGRTHF
ncbi:MAG: hypothetical protein HON27_14060 [Candidatus Marinimicrobia bacterium]|jgi:hypothetical protein|nr:hypothetical protein [Candidatus Neomarinimicrobiota bacterium]MBT4360439.1 hypothetical protein [Candidatus Neomarinimicrobiota bacterium]MBT4947276.1 hypothetical protein [Candidatus Neomarinimicrobiota bacterium]MBT5270726.1 hypothetical protein [Candidatus Neomarinimicrobiota bacterium]MBT6011580.1 hypothetical protein [Candidatus Neomarinimicrobiota bacterium]